jgi:hypothetical protein
MRSAASHENCLRRPHPPVATIEAAYLADSPETALYESVFRREVRNCHWDRLLERAMVTFETRAGSRVCMEFFMHRPSTRTTVAYAYSSRALSRPKS